MKLARRGVRVAASARTADKLADLHAAAPNVVSFPLDVTVPLDVKAVHDQIVRDLGGIDLAILNAGVWHPMDANAFDASRAAHSMSVNYIGIANALEPLIASMVARGRGQIALVASVAGYRGLPKAAAYAPSKSAVITLAEVLRIELQRQGIVVSVINPGFVETPMTSVNEFPMPFIIKADDAADRILKGLERGRFEIAFPWQLAFLLKLLRVLPNGIYLRIASRL